MSEDMSRPKPSYEPGRSSLSRKIIVPIESGHAVCEVYGGESRPLRWIDDESRSKWRDFDGGDRYPDRWLSAKRAANRRLAEDAR